MSPKPKPVRIIPPLTDVELDSRVSSKMDHGQLRHVGAKVTPDTLSRADEALRWHEKRAKGQAS